MTASATRTGATQNVFNTPARQIRALYDDRIITVYQAYSSEIAQAAVQHQKLSASPSFSINRMTWIKPSWCWMMYRCGYSYKDSRQTNVLALSMKHEHFVELLGHAQLAHEGSSRRTGAKVIVQWDPERGPRLEKYDFRSIQIGISRDICEKWVDEWIVDIRDVTAMARAMKDMIDQDLNVGPDALVAAGLMPIERVFDIPASISMQLNMIGTEDEDDDDDNKG